VSATLNCVPDPTQIGHPGGLSSRDGEYVEIVREVLHALHVALCNAQYHTKEDLDDILEAVKDSY